MIRGSRPTASKLKARKRKPFCCGPNGEPSRTANDPRMGLRNHPQLTRSAPRDGRPLNHLARDVTTALGGESTIRNAAVARFFIQSSFGRYRLMEIFRSR